MSDEKDAASEKEEGLSTAKSLGEKQKIAHEHPDEVKKAEKALEKTKDSVKKAQNSMAPPLIAACSPHYDGFNVYIKQGNSRHKTKKNTAKAVFFR